MADPPSQSLSFSGSSTVADSPRFGVKAVRPVTGAVRGAMLLPYWIVNGLAGGGSLSRMLAALGLVASTSIYAAFFPPRFWRGWVAARSRAAR